MMKRIVCILLAMLLLISVAACGTDMDEVAKTIGKNNAVSVRNDLEVFSKSDISGITDRIFGTVPNETSEEGIIADLFANAEAQIISADESTITYTIVSPDISNFFTEYANQLDSITTSEELGQAILEYAKTAPTKEYTVTVPYSVEEDDIVVAYNDPDFINAMTGGLLDAYSALYDLYLSEG